MSGTHPAAVPAALDKLSAEQQEEFEEARRWLAEAADLTLEDANTNKKDADGRLINPVSQMATICMGMESRVLAAAINAGDLHQLPDFVTKAVLMDTRKEVREALARDARKLESAAELLERHRAHLMALGITDHETLRQDARRTGVGIYRRIKARIEAGERGPLDAGETNFAVFLASHFPTRETVDTFMYFARQSPRIAEAILKNPLLIDPAILENPAEYLELIQGIVAGLLRVLGEQSARRTGEWALFLQKAYQLTCPHQALQKLAYNVLNAARLSPQAAEEFINERQISDEAIRQLITIQVAKDHADDTGWVAVFKALRLERFNLYKGAIRARLSAETRKAAESNF